jgi:hypothetical protein
MKMKYFFLGMAITLATAWHLQAQGTAFTYQGRLDDGGNPANGSYDLTFALHSAASGPTQLGSTLSYTAVAVSNGLFTVTLDFGNRFPGDNRWLEIGVCTNGLGTFATLAPRQALTSAPYAIQANNAASATVATSANSVSAANISGVLADSLLSANVALRAGGNTFSDPQTMNGALAALGNVGIGNSSPPYPLSFSSTLGDKISLYGGLGTHFGFGIQPSVLQIHTDLAVNDIVFGYGQSSNFTETVRIKGIGRMGIGTTNPQQLLQVGDTSVTNSQGMIRLNSRSGAGLAARSWDIGVPETDEDLTGIGYSFVINDNGSGSTPEFMIKYGSGNVGIGTTNPTAKLEIAGSVKGTAFAGDGSALTGLSASSISGGTVADARLSSNVALRSAANTFTGNQTINGALTVTNTYSGIGDFRLYAYQGNGSNGTAFVQARDSSGTSSIDLVLRSQLNGVLIDALRIQSNGNIGIGTPTPGTKLEVAGEATMTVCNITSDRNAKERFKPVNAREVLNKVANLPITEWQYKTQGDARHIGPMAQDFREAFSLGRDDKHITSVDADGVALAAIQGLNEKLEEKLAEKAREVEDLKQSVVELRELVNRLTSTARPASR